jgi:serine/threonine protein kinase
VDGSPSARLFPGPGLAVRTDYKAPPAAGAAPPPAEAGEAVGAVGAAGREPLTVKLIDFGAAVFCGSKRAPQCEPHQYIQSRFVRSPEILLGLPYDRAADIWSLGAILFEAATGKVLFPATDQGDLMRHHVQVLGPPPGALLHRAPLADRYFVREADAEDGGLGLSASSRVGMSAGLGLSGSTASLPTPGGSTASLPTPGGPLARKMAPSGRTLRLPVHFGIDRDGNVVPLDVPTHLVRPANSLCLGDHIEPARYARHARAYDHCQDLLLRLLRFEPSERLTPEGALRHAFFSSLAAADPPGLPCPSGTAGSRV